MSEQEKQGVLAKTAGYNLEARFYGDKVEIVDTLCDEVILTTDYNEHPRLGGIRDKQVARSRSVSTSSRRGTGSHALMGEILETLMGEPAMQGYL